MLNRDTYVRQRRLRIPHSAEIGDLGAVRTVLSKTTRRSYLLINFRFQDVGMKLWVMSLVLRTVLAL